MSGSMRLIVDRDGSVWSAYDEKLVERWGYPEPDFDLPSFAVRNLGAIDVAVEPDGIALTFRWVTVKQEALMGVSQLLSQLPSRPVRICFDGNGWTEESFADPEAASAWLQSNRTLWLGQTERNVVTTPRRLRALAERPLSKIEGPDDRLSLLFKKWRLMRGEFTDDTVMFFVQHGMIDRAIVAHQREQGDMAYQHVGADIKLYDREHPDWTYTAAGRPVIEQPDREYGRWAAAIYSDVIERREPAFDHVDAIVRDGQAISRFRYDRLLLPWQLSSGTKVITGLSFGVSAEPVAAA